MGSDTKSEILKSIKTGENGRALSFLYDIPLKKVRNYILKNRGSKEEANDIFQDAVIIFFNQVRLNKFDESKDIDGFIYFVARNLWISKMRRDLRMVPLIDPQQVENNSDFEDSLSDLISKEKSSAMQSVFAKLDEKCQKILSYFLFEKLSMKEISEKMGYSSEDVAKTNHYRCKQYLTKLVKSDLELVNLLNH